MNKKNSLYSSSVTIDSIGEKQRVRHVHGSGVSARRRKR
jgi:hypothetical protein